VVRASCLHVHSYGQGPCWQLLFYDCSICADPHRELLISPLQHPLKHVLAIMLNAVSVCPSQALREIEVTGAADYVAQHAPVPGQKRGRAAAEQPAPEPGSAAKADGPGSAVKAEAEGAQTPAGGLPVRSCGVWPVHARVMVRNNDSFGSTACCWNLFVPAMAADHQGRQGRRRLSLELVRLRMMAR
jgi:hypothetical protein